MILSKSRSQHHKNGVRISKALFDEIMTHVKHRGDTCDPIKGRNGQQAWYIGGMCAGVYAFVRKAGEVNWAEEMLRAGMIERLEDYEAPK